MPLSSAVRERCRTLLQPGEELRYLFPATSIGLSRAITGVAPFIVAVSDTDITVLSCEWLRRHQARPGGHLHGPDPGDRPPGPGDRRGVPGRGQAADAELDGTDGLPPDPLPDL